MKCLAAFTLALALAAQEPQFGVQSRLVLVPVTVTDAKGRPVDGLEPGDFVLLDNGRRQKATVDTIATGVAPIALVVAIQTSGISKPVLEKVRKIGALIQPLITGERGCSAVVSFSERVDWIQECTGDQDALIRAFAQVRPGEDRSGRMLDAIHAAVAKLLERPNSRRVLLLISESRDRGSESALQTVVIDTQAAGVTVYAATYSAFKTAFTTKTRETQMPKVPKTPSEQTGTMDGGPPHCGPAGCTNPQMPSVDQRGDLLAGIGELIRLGKTNDAESLTKATGGTTLPFTRLKGLEEAIQKLSSELHSQYLLSFTPEDSAAGYHKLEVRVGGGDLLVRARPGY